MTQIAPRQKQRDPGADNTHPPFQGEMVWHRQRSFAVVGVRTFIGRQSDSQFHPSNVSTGEQIG